MRLSRQFQFFLRKNFSTQKRKSRKNQLTKQKQANKKQQRQEIFVLKNF